MGYEILKFPYYPWYTFVRIFAVGVSNTFLKYSHSFSGLTAIAMFLMTREVWSTEAGLLAAACMAIVPGYISRSVAGSYDNEGIAIFALLFTYFLWLRSVKTGSVFWATACSVSYFYMVGHISHP
eukprot:TRINITY_DN1366_c0_g1_i4.p1 TRINITY_DN1366_c0_g1~~TRINITY_DN1366_c0_g1_i4.p1  ORF type:complete len:125 (-),score=8.75 TRINITY_DN1366_c0_g1_i4:433-807(-)